MVRESSEEAVRQRAAVRDRVKFLLDYHWGGNQRQMARDLAVSQGLISKIVRGHQGAGKRFLATLARQPGVNAGWVLRGEGQPLNLPPRGTLPVAAGVLPGLPEQHAHLLTGARHPVAEALDRPSRYWLELPSGSPLLGDESLRLLAGDLLLIEADPAWTGRPDLVDGRLGGIRLARGQQGTEYPLGKFYRSPQGLIFEALDTALRLFTFPAPPSAHSPEMVPLSAPEAPEPEEPPRARRRRTVRMLEHEERKAEARNQGGQNQPMVRAEPEEQPAAALTLQDIVAVCVYLARPSPGIGRVTDAAEGPPTGQPSAS